MKMFQLNLYYYLVAWTIFKLADANSAYVAIDGSGGEYPALIFAEQKEHIFLVSEKFMKPGEKLMFTCPPSKDEIKSFLTVPQSSQDEETPPMTTDITDTENLQTLSSKSKINSKNSSPNHELMLPASDSKVKSWTSPLPLKGEINATGSSSKSQINSKNSSPNHKSMLPVSDSKAKSRTLPLKDEIKALTSLAKNNTLQTASSSWTAKILPRFSLTSRKKKQSPSSSSLPSLPSLPSMDEEENSEISSSLSYTEEDTEESSSTDEIKSENNQTVIASLALPVDEKWRPSLYYCENEYKPQTTFAKHCRRFRENGIEEKAELYSVGYKVQIDQHKTNLENDLLVYAKCYSYDLRQTFYVMYKIVSLLPTTTEPRRINYDFDPTEINSKNIITPYHFNEQGEMLKKLDSSITDKLIPQRLIPEFSISTDFSKGAMSDDHNIFSPQWLSKAEIWDDLSRIIFQHGKKHHWLIYTGTIGTCYSAINNKPLVLKQKTGSKLSVPLYWWTLIMKINSTQGRGIIVGMLNQPSATRMEIPRNFQKLCLTNKTCEDYGWGEIMNDTNSPFLICCRVTSALTEQLIGDSINLYPLSLKTEIKNEMEHDSVNVSSLLDDFNYIEKRSEKARAGRDLKASSPPELPPAFSIPEPKTGPLSTISTPLSSAFSSPDRQAESELPEELVYTSASSNLKDDETN